MTGRQWNRGIVNGDLRMLVCDAFSRISKICSFVDLLLLKQPFAKRKLRVAKAIVQYRPD